MCSGYLMICLPLRLLLDAWLKPTSAWEFSVDSAEAQTVLSLAEAGTIPEVRASPKVFMDHRHPDHLEGSQTWGITVAGQGPGICSYTVCQQRQCILRFEHHSIGTMAKRVRT